MTYVRRHARAGELVYHPGNAVVGWAQWGGVPQPFRSWMDMPFGLPNVPLTARDMMLKRLPADVDAYRAHGFAWFVLDDHHPLASAGDAWIREGDAHEAARFGSLRVIALEPKPARE